MSQEHAVPSTTGPDTPGSVGIVQTQQYTFAHPPHELELECGRKLGPIALAYETYGRLNAARDNAILIVHALSGDAHAAGLHDRFDKAPGWWDIMVGPGKPFDTDRYCVICSNLIGGCKGSIGPSSTNLATGEPYGLTFPVITIRDMVEAQRHLIDFLGIDRLYAVSGGSMGGMQVLQWAISYPERVAKAIPIATTASLSAQAIAFNEVGRQAIMADPDWLGGDYYGATVPRRGLALARMVGHITYLSEPSMHRKFARRLQERAEYGYDFATEFQVESYLKHKGDHFVNRFDANSYLYLTKAMDYFDLARSYGSLRRAFAAARAAWLVISFSSDWLFPTHQSKAIVRALRQNNLDVIFTEIQTDYGHDAFLLEAEEIGRLVTSFWLTEPERAARMATLLDEARQGAWRRPEGLAPEHQVIIDLIPPGSRVLDLGCGGGDLLQALVRAKAVRAEGIDLSDECIQACVAKGVANVQHGDLDEGLADYADQSVDYVILTNTIQVLHRPLLLIREMARVGKQCVIGFPNFAHWPVRWQLLLGGHMPKSPRLPYEWYDTPNIHLTTIRDFREFCARAGLTVLREVALRTANGVCRPVRFLPNLLADQALFVVSRKSGGRPPTPGADGLQDGV